MTDDAIREQATGLFKRIYTEAGRDSDAVPWAALDPCQEVVDLLGTGPGRAVVVGCGLGDDAAALARAGWETVAFDISPDAIDWCRERFGDIVDWRVADLLDLPEEWEQAFDLVIENRTIQSLPPALRPDVVAAIASLVGHRLLVIATMRPHHVIPTGPPWAVSEIELEPLETAGLEREAVRIEGTGPGARLAGTWVRS